MSAGETYRAKGIVKSFGPVQILYGIDFDVKPGTIHGLLGHNGAGKSTLLRILAGAQPQDDGELSIGSEALMLDSPRDALAKGIGCVYQELRLIPNLSVAENLFLGREIARSGFKNSAVMNDYARKLLSSYGLDIDVKRPMKDLSHPDKQLIEVISNLDSNARFILLDEPTTALDGRQSADLLGQVRRIATERNIGVVLVSHKLDEVLTVCAEITVLSGGRVVYRAAGETISKQAIVDAIVGDARSHSVTVTKRAAAAGEVFLRVSGLGGERLKGVDLEARRGEVLGLYGLVGSGRTRFLRTLYGMEPVTTGTIELDNRAYHPISTRTAIESGIAFLTEERKVDGFIPMMSAYRNVTLSTLQRYRRHGLVSVTSALASAAEILARIDTRGRLDSAIKSLSGGNQQKVLFGRIIEQNADLVLLDEPTKGVDIGSKADIYDIVRGLADEGRCIIVVSSEEEELLEMSDRIAIFQHGHCSGIIRAASDWTLGSLREAAWASAA